MRFLKNCEAQVLLHYQFKTYIMKTTALIIALLCNSLLFAQAPYEKGMQKAMELMATDQQAAAAQFERIASVEKENWLPVYYAALCHINSSWSNTPEKTQLYLQKAQELLDTANSLSPNNAELLVLQGMLNTSYIVMDGNIYGMKLSGPTTAIYEKAFAIAPSNPRVIMNRAQWNMGSARYFGKDVTPYCTELELAASLFEKEVVTGFNPSWGKNQLPDARKDCK